MTALCRFCGAPLTIELIDLGRQPLANANLARDAEAVAAERRFPLRVMACGACRLTQVEQSVPPDAIFNAEYAYFSSYSASWVAHAKAYAEAMIARFGLSPAAQVVEVASNDGYLLKHFVAAGVPALGVEPAANCAAAAEAVGVPTRVAFFGAETADALVAEGFAADLTAANNVLAHVPDIADFVAGFRRILKPEGVATFEFPHLLRLIEDAQFDTIYHEHYSYLSLVALERIFGAAEMRVFDVEKLPTHGGSLRLFTCRRDASHAETRAVVDLRAEESAARLDADAGYAALAPRAEKIRDGFRAYLAEAKAAGLTVAGYGAAAKGATFLNYCGVGPDDLAFLVDRNPEKQGKLAPGSHIPIEPVDALKARKPDRIVILPWNLAAEIAREHAYVAEWGGRFVVATPEIRDVTAER